MLTKKTFLGAGWTVSSRLVTRGVDFVCLLVLARWLTPADFGLIAVATILIGVTDVVLELPLNMALTRLRELRKEHLDTAFTLGLMRSGVLVLIMLCAAWPFSIFFHDDRLIALIFGLMLGPMARSLNSPSLVTYIRDIDFRTIFIAETTAKLTACGLSLLVLFSGGGYWAIVVSSAAPHVIMAVLSYVLAPYRPALSLRELPVFIGFIGWFSSAQLVSAVNWQLEKMLLGPVVPKAELGRYSMATDIAVLPSQSVIGPAMQPVMAAFSMINNDRPRLQRAYLAVSRLTMLLSVPAFVGMALSADLIVGLLLGPQWSDAAPFLQGLAIATMLTSYYQPLSSVAMAIDQPSVLFRLNLIDLLTRAVLLTSAFYFFSIFGMIIAKAVTAFLMFILQLVTVRRLLDLSITAQLMNLWQVFLACLLMVVVILGARHLTAGLNLRTILEFGFVATVGAAVYLGTLLALGVRVNLRPNAG